MPYDVAILLKPYPFVVVIILPSQGALVFPTACKLCYRVCTYATKQIVILIPGKYQNLTDNFTHFIKTPFFIE